MKKKLLVLVAMLLCVVTVLASCASSMKFEKVVGDGTYSDENPTLTTAAKTDLKGTYTPAKGDLIVLEETNTETGTSTYTVYNVATGAVVYTAANSEKTEGNVTTVVKHNIKINTQWDTTWFVDYIETKTTTAAEGQEPVEDKKYTASLRDAKGAEFATATDIADVDDIDRVCDLIVYNEKAYRIADDGTIAHAFDYSALRGPVDESLKKVGEYYFNEMELGFSILDAQLNTVVVYNMPYYMGLGELMDSDFGGIHTLANGNVLVQYVVMLDALAEEYDFVMMASKFDLRTVLVDAEKSKVKELDLDYMVMKSDYKDHDDDSWFYGEKVENIAIVAYCEDGQIDLNENNMKRVALGNNGKIDGVIDDLIPNMSNAELKHVATNRWIVENKMGQSFLLNEKGDIIGEVTGIDEDEMNANFFVLNDKIYDWDLNAKYDMYANKAEDTEKMNHSILLKNEDGETLLYVNGEVKTLINKATAEAGTRELVVISGALYAIKDTATEGKTKYEIYNDAGTLLITLEDVVLDKNACVIKTASSNNAVLIAAVTIPTEANPTETTVYYRVG